MSWHDFADSSGLFCSRYHNLLAVPKTSSGGRPLNRRESEFPYLNSFYELSLGLWDCERIANSLRGMPWSYCSWEWKED